MNTELLQFYYSNLHETRELSWPRDSSRIAAAASSTALPLGENGYTEYVSRSDQSNRMDYVVACDFVSPGYFSSMGMPVLRGRGITDADNGERPARVLVVDTNVASHLYHGTEAVGQHLSFLSENWEIVGIVPAVRHFSLDGPPSPVVYGPQSYSAATTSIMVRSALSATPLSAAIRDTLRSVDPDQPIANLRTLEPPRMHWTSTDPRCDLS